MLSWEIHLHILPSWNFWQFGHKIFFDKFWQFWKLILQISIIFDNFFYKLAKDTRSSLQSPLSKTKPNHISETIVSNTAIFSDSAKPNILSLWTFEKYVELWKTPILDHVGLLKWYNSQTQTCEKAAVLFEMSSVNNFYNIVFFNWVIFDCLSTICSKGTVFGLHP